MWMSFFRINLRRAFTREPQRMCVHSSACLQGAAHPGSTSERRLLRQQHHTYRMRHVTLMNAWWRLTRKRRNSWISRYFCFLCAQKVASRSFRKLRLNHWCHMDYFNFIKNILICVPKMNKDLMDLEQHEGEKLMTEFSFLGELSL